jgi:putative ABC transport system substrate-binding protein
MRRREFITLLGGAAVWPLSAHAQQDERVRRIGVLMPYAERDPGAKAGLEAFFEALKLRGWSVGRKLQIDARWTAGNSDRLRKYAIELAASEPDLILTSTNRAVRPLREATRTVPVVFVLAIDPVGVGDVASLAHPGGNVTGFLLFEYSISGKWLELLKQIAPGVRRVAVLRDPVAVSGIGQFAAIQTLAAPFKVELTPIDIRDAGEIERGITAFTREMNGGLIVTASVAVPLHRDLIYTLAARYQLPNISPFHENAEAGGLIAYGPDLIDQYRAAANYVDRILKGEKPAELPVQAPTKYELVINLKTAKALGLAVPPALLARTDRVIE